MKLLFVLCGGVLSGTAFAQAPVSLPEVRVFSSRVANQEPAGTFAMPVSALRYEPQVDIHARNLAEGQADITIRGGIFENTGFQVGAVSVGDPQTGHYFAEIPIAPAMLTAPVVLTGADLVHGAMNASAGSVQYGWRPVRTGGAASAGVGEHALARAEIYQGVVHSLGAPSHRIGADVSVAHSESDGAIPFGEHRFDRLNGRVQLTNGAAQTDLFAGYQAKSFGWPNLYTPFNSNETENLQTALFALNHRVTFGTGEFFAAGAYHRRNKDDYAFNRFAPVGAVHPFQHTTWVTGLAIDGRRDLGVMALRFRGEAATDEIDSTSLTFGRFRTREFRRVSLVPEKAWAGEDGSRTTVQAGVGYDDTNRDTAAFSPVFQIAREFPAQGLKRIYLSYTESSQLPSYTALNSSATAGLFRGNPALGRQETKNVEVGVSGELRGWSAQAAVFWRQDDALVDWTFRRGVTARTANAVDMEVGGVEVVARRSWGPADVVIGYTGLTKDASYRGATVDASFYALNYARHRLTAAFTWRLAHGFELRCDNVARIQADNALRLTGGDEAITSSAALAYRPVAWRGVELAVQVDNLWNSDFQEVPAVPASPRQVSVGVAYAW